MGSFKKTPLIKQLIDDGENIKFFVDKKINDKHPLTMKVSEASHNCLFPNQAVYLVECSHEVVAGRYTDLIIDVGRGYSLIQNLRESKPKMVPRKCVIERTRNKGHGWNIKSIIKYEAYEVLK